MNKALHNYYWFTVSLLPKFLFAVLLLAIAFAILEHDLKALGISPAFVLIWLIAIFVTLGWSAILVVVFYKCPSCKKRALVQWGQNPKRVKLNRPFVKRFFISDEMVSGYFYCCQCGHKIESNQ